MKGLFRLFIFVFLLADAMAAAVWWTHPKGARTMGYSGVIPFAKPDKLPFKLPYDMVFKSPGGGAAGSDELPKSVTDPVSGQLKSGLRRGQGRKSRRRPRRRKPTPRPKTDDELDLEEIADEVGATLPKDTRVHLEEEESSGLLNQAFDSYE